MSWKSIEMQVALPRTQDAGKLQDQMMKQGQHFQESLAQSQLKQEELKRKKVQQSDDVEEAKIQKDTDSQHGETGEQAKKEKDYEESQSVQHPFLGTKFDFSG